LLIPGRSSLYGSTGLGKLVGVAVGELLAWTPRTPNDDSLDKF